MDSGFAGGEDESYNVYDQPFRGGRDMASNIYRPSKNIDKDAYADDFDTLMQNNRYLLLICYIFNVFKGKLWWYHKYVRYEVFLHKSATCIFSFVYI